MGLEEINEKIRYYLNEIDWYTVNVNEEIKPYVSKSNEENGLDDDLEELLNELAGIKNVKYDKHDNVLLFRRNNES